MQESLSDRPVIIRTPMLLPRIVADSSKVCKFLNEEEADQRRLEQVEKVSETES